MKKLFILFVFTLMFASCKEEEVSKSLADQVAGEYTVAKFNLGGTVINLPIESGTDYMAIDMQLNKETDTSVKLVLTILSGSKASPSKTVDDNGVFDLTQNAAGEIELLQAGSKTGYYKDGELFFDSDIEGLPASFTASSTK